MIPFSALDKVIVSYSFKRAIEFTLFFMLFLIDLCYVAYNRPEKRAALGSEKSLTFSDLYATLLFKDQVSDTRED